jgi:hypothetical protein
MAAGRTGGMIPPPRLICMKKQEDGLPRPRPIDFLVTAIRQGILRNFVLFGAAGAFLDEIIWGYGIIPDAGYQRKILALSSEL